MSSAPLSWRGAASITADGKSQREGDLSLGMCCPALRADSLAKETRLGSKIAISAIAGVLLVGEDSGDSSWVEQHFKSQSCAETHQELGLAS